jgi:CheY-like chemotaxis protein
MAEIKPDSLSSYPKIILHIDDDPDDRYFVKRAITSIDPSIILREAQNGKKAIEFLNQARLFGDLPNLIILDINMPVMDGHDTYKEINKDPELSLIPIIVFTTSFDNTELHQWKERNILMVTKPPFFDDFTTSIKNMLAYSSQQLRNK